MSNQSAAQTALPETGDEQVTQAGMPAAILEAALEAFAERGYDGMSVRELNRQLGASHNLVHHYFGSKEALWRAAIDYGLGRAAGIFQPERWADVEEPIEVLRRAIRHFIETTAKSPSVQRILEREAASGGERLNYMADRYIVRQLANDDFFRKITDYEARGLHEPTLVLLLASGAASLFTQAALARKLGVEDPFAPATIEKHIETFTHVLFYGLLGEAPKAAVKRRKPDAPA
jgi:AcrR family transcriptional regulator